MRGAGPKPTSETIVKQLHESHSAFLICDRNDSLHGGILLRDQ
jgi:hypothetical protein